MKEYNITVVDTNNPAIVKFEANHFLVKDNYEYKNIDEAKNSPLAQQLFHLPFIKTVYISGNFVALERFNIVQWNDVKDEVAQSLVDYLNAGEPIVQEESDKKTPTTIYTEVTPNPAVMKFVANRMLVPRIFEFKNIDEAKNSELATKLFHFPFIKEVFLDNNYISITKYDRAEWNEIAMELRDFIYTYFNEGKEAVDTSAIEENEKQQEIVVQNEVDLDDTSKRIISILDEYVKPAVASDGGNIQFQSYEENTKTVSVILQGACSGCPSSTFTLKNGIETMLKQMLGDKVNEVIALNG